MINYRKIYEDHYGEIPKDELGRTYDIHHIDGDRSNNYISNLKAVSIEEHWQIHTIQGDYDAANLIAERLGLELYSGYKRPKHSERMMGEKNPMFGKLGKDNPSYGKKRPKQSEWMKLNGGKYVRSEKQKEDLRKRSINKVVCKDINNVIQVVDKSEFYKRSDLFGVSANAPQPKLRKKIRCIEDDLIFNSIKEASLFYNNIGSSGIVKSLKHNKCIGQNKLKRCIRFEYILEQSQDSPETVG